MTTFSTNAPYITNTDAGYQNWVNEILTGLVTQCGLTQVADTCSVNSTNYNAVMTVNAQTATNQLTVNSISVGGNNICIGMQVVGTGIAAGTYITALGTGTGGTGTYTLSTTPGTIAAESMTISFKVPAAAATAYAYCMLRFNDTLQATSPIYIKLEFGSGNGGVAVPQMWITLGTGTNGSGTITGSTIPKSACGYASAGLNNPGGGVNYLSYYCYNATQGAAWMGFKYGSSATSAAVFPFGFAIFRSVDNTGAPTADAVHLLCNTLNALPGSPIGGNLGIYDYNRSANIIGTTAPNGITASWVTTGWGIVPFGNYSTVLGTTAQVFPCFQWKGNSTTPGIGITNAVALGAQTDWASVGTTGTFTIIGSTSLTYIAVGPLWGYPSLTTAAYTATNVILLPVYQ